VKSWLALSVLTLAALVAAGCGSSSAKTTTTVHSSSSVTDPAESSQADEAKPRIRVVAGSYPLAWLAEEIGGDTVDVTNLTPPGANPRTYVPTDDDLADLKAADLVLVMGHGYQPALEAAVAKAGVPKVSALDIPGTSLVDTAGGSWTPGSTTTVNPFVWLDPIRFKTIGFYVSSKMDRDPERMRGDLTGLAIDTKIMLTTCATTAFSTSDNAWSYYANRFLLTAAAPTPRDAGLAVAADLATKLDPVASPTKAQLDDGDDYLSLQQANAKVLRAALSCTNPLS
jgi:zinc transport system substrate-binding protein